MCPEDVSYFPEADLCIKVFELPLNWTQARDYCWYQGGRLAVLDTQAKLDYGLPYIVQSKISFLFKIYIYKFRLSKWLRQAR